MATTSATGVTPLALEKARKLGVKDHEHVGSVVILHGLGDTAAGWTPTAMELIRHVKGLHTVLPTAPRQPVTINGGARCPSWYDIEGLGPDADIDIAGLDAAVAAVVPLLEAEAEKVGWDRVGLIGFSQGGAVAYHLLLSDAVPKMGGIAILSSYLPRPHGFTLPPLDDSVPPSSVLRTPLFHGHGSADAVVAFAWGKHSADAVAAAGYDLTWREYDGMGHSFCDAEYVDLKAFIRANIVPTPDA